MLVMTTFFCQLKVYDKIRVARQSVSLHSQLTSNSTDIRGVSRVFGPAGEHTFDFCGT